jgi:hypothetical protein
MLANGKLNQSLTVIIKGHPYTIIKLQIKYAFSKNKIRS